MAPLSLPTSRSDRWVQHTTMLSVLLLVLASSVTAAHGRSHSLKTPLTNQASTLSSQRSLRCAWMSSTCSSWGFSFVPPSSSPSSSPLLVLRGGSSDESDPTPVEEAEETVEDETASSASDESTEASEDHDASPDDDGESDEVIDMDDNSLDVRGGSSCEPGQCSGGTCTPKASKEEATDEDEDEVPLESNDNQSEQAPLECEDETDTPAASVTSVPPGGASDVSDESEPSNGHTAVADGLEEEEDTPLESAEEAVVVTETAAPQVAEEAPAAAVAVEAEPSQPEESVAEEEAADEVATPTPEPDAATQVADAVATAAAAAAAGDQEASPAAVQEIDADTAKILIQELKYRRYEVRNMQPHIAAIVVEKRLRRPQEGIPPSWYVDSSKVPPAWRQHLEEWLPRLVVPVLVGGIGVTVYLLQKGDGGLPSLSMEPLTSWIKSIPPVRVSRSTTAVTPTTAAVAVAATPVPEASTTTTTIEAPAAEAAPAAAAAAAAAPHDAHQHSIKPFVHDKPPAEEELDQSWLDKVLTGISKGVKAIFQKNI